MTRDLHGLQLKVGYVKIQDMLGDPLDYAVILQESKLKIET